MKTSLATTFSKTLKGRRLSLRRTPVLAAGLVLLLGTLGSVSAHAEDDLIFEYSLSSQKADKPATQAPKPTVKKPSAPRTSAPKVAIDEEIMELPTLTAVRRSGSTQTNEIKVEPKKETPPAAPKTQPKAPEAKPATKQPEVKSETKRPEPKPETKQPEAKPEIKQPEAKPETKQPEAKPETKKPETKAAEKAPETKTSAPTKAKDTPAAPAPQKTENSPSRETVTQGRSTVPSGPASGSDEPIAAVRRRANVAPAPATEAPPAPPAAASQTKSDSKPETQAPAKAATQANGRPNGKPATNAAPQTTGAANGAPSVAPVTPASTAPSTAPSTATNGAPAVQPNAKTKQRPLPNSRPGYARGDRGTDGQEDQESEEDAEDLPEDPNIIQKRNQQVQMEAGATCTTCTIPDPGAGLERLEDEGEGILDYLAKPARALGYAAFKSSYEADPRVQCLANSMIGGRRVGRNLCYRAVKQGMKAAGAVDRYLPGVAASMAISELRSSSHTGGHPYMNIMDEYPKQVNSRNAPQGSVLVYTGPWIKLEKDDKRAEGRKRCRGERENWPNGCVFSEYGQSYIYKNYTVDKNGQRRYCGGKGTQYGHVEVRTPRGYAHFMESASPLDVLQPGCRVLVGVMIDIEVTKTSAPANYVCKAKSRAGQGRVKKANPRRVAANRRGR